MNPDRFFKDDPEAVRLWARWLIDRGKMKDDGIVHCLLKMSVARDAYAASLARKHSDEFPKFATYRRLTK